MRCTYLFIETFATDGTLWNRHFLVWSCWCLLRPCLYRKLLQQTVHLYERSPLWASTWCLRVSFSLNRLPQIAHSNGLSLLWSIWCLVRLRLYGKLLLQTVHWNKEPSLAWSFRWLARLDSYKKPLLHTLHLNEWFSVWINLCLLRPCFRLKRLLQIVHSNGVPLVWSSWCLVRPRLYGKLLLQILHSNKAPSPLWSCLCLVRLRLYGKLLPQIVHSNKGFSLVWRCWCLRRLRLCKKHLLQTLHLNECSSVWINPCLLRCCLVLKGLLQMGHSNERLLVWMYSCTMRSHFSSFLSVAVKLTAQASWLSSLESPATRNSIYCLQTRFYT